MKSPIFVTYRFTIVAALLFLALAAGSSLSCMNKVRPTQIASTELEAKSNSNVSGSFQFRTLEQGILIQGEVKGLNPQSLHGIHIHEKGDCSDLKALKAGGHFNPRNAPHGLPEQKKRHAGDLGNLSANHEGVAKFRMVAKHLSLRDHEASVLGRALVVHQKPDTGEQPSGNAGPRIACGVIQ